MPESSIINITGASVGRALANHPIQLHSFESNINHLHITFSVNEQQLDNIVSFFQNALSLISRGINRIHDREGHVFGGRARHHPCLDDETAAQKYLYGLTNAQKDNLIDRTSSSPFFSTFNHQAKGKDLKYWLERGSGSVKPSLWGSTCRRLDLFSSSCLNLATYDAASGNFWKLQH